MTSPVPYDDISVEIQSLYIAYLGRPTDWLHVLTWEIPFVDSANRDLPIEQLGEGEEYLSWVDNFNDPAEIINAIYHRLFNRDAGPEGLAFYGNLLASGKATIATVPMDIMNGAINDDAIILDNKAFFAQDFADELRRVDANYGEAYDQEAIALLTEEVGINRASQETQDAMISLVDSIVYSYASDTLPPSLFISFVDEIDIPNHDIFNM